MQGLTASSSSSSSSLPPKLKVDVIVIKKLIEELERGQKSADMMRNIILEYYSAVKLEGFHNNINNNTHNNNNNDNNNEDYLNALLDHHSKVALDTYATSLSILKSCHFDGNKDLHSSGDSLRRDCNKRRKNVESKEKEVTHLTDDGYIWRKYGQKQIITHHHPREYYRCTHKREQKCEATKQVQQISDNPTKYKIIYNDRHTCNNNFLETTPFIMDSLEEPSSAIVVSFDGSNHVNPLLFPTSAFPNTTMNQNKDQFLYNYCAVSSSNEASLQSEEVAVVDDYNALMAAGSELLCDW